MIWIPAGAGAFHALYRTGEGAMRVAMHFATVTALAMMLGLMRWPSIHWELALAYIDSPPEQRGAIDAVFMGLNRYPAIVAEVNNYLLPAFMIVFGVSLLKYRGDASRIDLGALD